MQTRRHIGRSIVAVAAVLWISGIAGAAAGTYDIRDYGAVPDGKTLNTTAIQAAIDACAKDQGGTVLVPAGVFVLGATELKSNVTLHIATAGTLLGVRDANQYHATPGVPTSGDSTMGDGNWALIYAVNATNVTVEGPGMIDGGGPPPEGIRGSHRPYALLFHRCRSVAVQNIEMVRCPFHMIRLNQSAYLRLEGINIHNRVAVNDDGFHFVSCEYVIISNCNVLTQDDGCALFGSCKHVNVTNCHFSTRWSVFRFGGGSVEDITVSNCVLHQVYGCPFKFQGGPGSRFENLSFSNIILDDVTGPISISISSPAEMERVAEDQQPAEPSQPAQPVRRQGPCIVRNIAFNNVRGTVVTTSHKPTDYLMGRHYGAGETYSAIVLNSLGSAIMENVSFQDVSLTFGGGGTAEMGANRNVPERSGEYFSLGAIPAYALYARNVKGLTLQNVRFQVAGAEQRPAIIFDHLQDVLINGLSVQGDKDAESVLRFRDSQDVLMTGVRVLTPSAVFLRVEGAGNANIKIDGGDLSKAAKPLDFAAGADEKAVTLRP